MAVWELQLCAATLSCKKSALQDVVKPHTHKVLTFVSGVYQVSLTFLPPWVRLEIRGNISISFTGHSSHSAKRIKFGVTTSAWRLYFTVRGSSGPVQTSVFVCFVLHCSASVFPKSNEGRRSKQGKVFSKLISRRYARHFHCYHLPLPARRALRSRQALNQSVHFSRDLLRTLMKFRAGGDWNFHLLSHLGTYVTEALLYALATLCFPLPCQVGRGIVGFCNWHNLSID